MNRPINKFVRIFFMYKLLTIYIFFFNLASLIHHTKPCLLVNVHPL